MYSERDNPTLLHHYPCFCISGVRDGNPEFALVACVSERAVPAGLLLLYQQNATICKELHLL